MLKNKQDYLEEIGNKLVKVEDEKFEKLAKSILRLIKKSNLKKEPNPLYVKMVDVYNDFCKEKIGVGGKFGKKEGDALKSIIDYLKQNIKNKEGGDEEVSNAWEFVLKNVDKWDRFHQGQLTLNQINSNFINILNSIKNGNKQSKPNGVIQANSHAEFVANILNDPEFKGRTANSNINENKHLPAK